MHVTLWRMSMETGVAVDAGYWLLFWSWLQSWIVAVNMETYKYNSTFSLSEYWRIFTSYTNLGFASVCILVNIRQYSLRLQVLLYTYHLHIETTSDCAALSVVFGHIMNIGVVRGRSPVEATVASNSSPGGAWEVFTREIRPYRYLANQTNAAPPIPQDCNSRRRSSWFTQSKTFDMSSITTPSTFPASSATCQSLMV